MCAKKSIASRTQRLPPCVVGSLLQNEAPLSYSRALQRVHCLFVINYYYIEGLIFLSDTIYIDNRPNAPNKQHISIYHKHNVIVVWVAFLPNDDY